MKHRACIVIVSSRIIEKSSRESIRVIDTKTTKMNYIMLKYLDHYDLIDMKVRNMFKKDFLSLVLKYYYHFSTHRTRDNMINIEKTNAS